MEKKEEKGLTIGEMLKAGKIKQHTYDAVQLIKNEDKKKRVVETINRRIAGNEFASDGS